MHLRKQPVLKSVVQRLCKKRSKLAMVSEMALQGGGDLVSNNGI